MKKIILIIALGVGLGSASAFAYDNDYRYYNDNDNNYNYRFDRHAGFVSPDIGRRVNHLNRMLQHVRWEADRTPGSFRMRRELNHAAFEVNRVNELYRRGFDPYRLNRKIDIVHSQLHNIEVRLHFRSNEWFRWE